MTEQGRLRSAYDALLAGRISRRDFINRASALGVAAPVTLFLLRTVDAMAQGTPTAGQPIVIDGGTEGQKRGAGGELKLLQWQAPTTLSVQTSNSFKDMLAAALVTEPLLHYLPDGTPIPCLVKEVPSVENGLVSPDYLSVTYNLLENVVWSDGEPFTANDVIFTWRWIMDKANQSTNIGTYEPIANIEAPNDHQVKITFKSPQLGWYVPFASATIGGIYPAHVLSKGKSANQQFAEQPIGTGPYVVESFKPGDQVIYGINEKYREPNKPYFSKVNLKGGGDAVSAARAVLQTGDWDFAWNLLVEPNVLDSMEKGGKGSIVVVPGTAVERIVINFSDPNKEVDGQRSYWKQPHPFLSDKSVRQALSLGCDRMTISTHFYSGPPGEPPTSNILVGIPQYESHNTSWAFDVEKGKQLLEDAGWKLNGKIREKNGVQLKMVYSTSTNLVRQQTQAVIKKSWEELGFSVRLKEVDAAIFFDTSAGNDQNVNHMYVDVHMYAFSPASPYPLSYMEIWTSQDGKNIPQRENGWSQFNEGRYHNPAYDQLYFEAVKETDPKRAADLFIKMNDILIDDVAIIPLVQRAAEKYGISTKLRKENIIGGSFEALYWNIANWTKA